MTPSPRCIAFIQGFEACRLHGYLPTPADVPTCGWGSTGPDVTMHTVWTQAEADARFAHDLAKFAHGVDQAIDGAATTQDQADALVSLAYNIGLTNFATSTLLKLHKAGQYREAADQFLRWNRQKGAILAGLTRRRAGEARMYLGQV